MTTAWVGLQRSQACKDKRHSTGGAQRNKGHGAKEDATEGLDCGSLAKPSERHVAAAGGTRT